MVINVMQPCFLRIVTLTDGMESVFSQEANIELAPSYAKLWYEEKSGRVCLCLENGRVFIERKGDYALCLWLAEGERLSGKIGLLGAEGNVETDTHRIAYTLKKDSLLLSMKYTLRFSVGKQEMNLTLIARVKSNSEEK